MDLFGELHLTVGARSSALSRAQVQEVLLLLRIHHPAVVFIPAWVATVGDLDLLQSLKEMDKTDFFTREIDQMLLQGHIRIAIHSAKDLPAPLPEGLCCVALTRGVDSADVLVLREGDALMALPTQAKIATSSIRRELMIKQIRPDIQCIEVRGPIDRRLEFLDQGDIDGLVMAEAALIRLHKMQRNRIRLPGLAAPFQGQLAVLARVGDQEISNRFQCIDVGSHFIS